MSYRFASKNAVFFDNDHTVVMDAENNALSFAAIREKAEDILKQEIDPTTKIF